MPTAALPAALRVRAPLGPPRPVNRNLFGKFTEHLGRNVYGGAWAQLARNPEFAPAEAWPDRRVLLRRLQEAGPDFGLPALASALADRLPPWWLAEGFRAVEAAERRGRPVLRLAGAGRLLTPLHLPVQRTCSHRLLLHLRGDMPVRVALTPRGESAWAEAALHPAGGWATHEVVLQGRGPAPAAGTPFQLSIETEGAGSVELRRCLLFPSDHLDGWDPDVVGFMRQARLPLLRFPGGNFASAYRWRDGIGPVEDRPVKPNPAWPEVEWNHVGTDEWVRLCALVGCTPLICVNAGDGSAEEAADWVEYCNGGLNTPLGALRALNGHPEPYGVRLWEVGNELYGSWQVGATDAPGYAARYRDYAAVMTRRDPGIRLIANGDTEGWNRTLVFAAADRVRSLSHHCLYGGYAEGADPRRVYLEHMAFTPAYGRMWRELTRPMVEAGLTPRLAITEQQIFTQRPELPNNATLTEAIWTASILHEALRAGALIELLTHSALINHGGGLRKEREVVYAQPVWWVTHLYGGVPEELHVLEVEVETPRFSAEPHRLRTAPDAPYLDAAALGDAAGSVLYLYLLNRHPDIPLAVSLQLPAAPFAAAQRITLTGDSFMAQNSWDHPDNVAPISEELPLPPSAPLLLPPCSLVRLRLSV